MGRSRTCSSRAWGSSCSTSSSRSNVLIPVELNSPVTPANAGVQGRPTERWLLDSRFRGNDDSSWQEQANAGLRRHDDGNGPAKPYELHKQNARSGSGRLELPLSRQRTSWTNAPSSAPAPWRGGDGLTRHCRARPGHPRGALQDGRLEPGDDAEDSREPPWSSIVAVGALHALVALLGLDRQGRDRARFEAADADRLVGFLAEAVGAGVDAAEGGVDLGDEFAFPLAGAQLNRAVGFERSAVGQIRLQQTLFLEVLQRPGGIGEQFRPPSQQLLAEVFHLERVHELFVF